jgi:hypothetical protein
MYGVTPVSVGAAGRDAQTVDTLPACVRYDTFSLATLSALVPSIPPQVSIAFSFLDFFCHYSVTYRQLW